MKIEDRDLVRQNYVTHIPFAAEPLEKVGVLCGWGAGLLVLVDVFIRHK